MTNSVDLDQMPGSAVSDLGLHCLQRPICPNTIRVITVIKDINLYIISIQDFPAL